ncbi:MAG: NAD(P)/FAD-dependent oxidoreductase [Pseudomonadota bacterium]|nr:NAD(P)/FAD-dependent oxidoreductase [Pseudomonadota bacterium]
MNKQLPIAIIGAGPVGLAAAAHVLSYGGIPLVLEKGPTAAHAVRQWGHVQLFSPWRFNVDKAAKKLLEETGWSSPDPERHPTGHELADLYLEPLSRHSKVDSRIRYNATVTSVAKAGVDKVKNDRREERPFVLRIESSQGHEEDILAAAVIDATGNWFSPNPGGANGLPAPGEKQAAPFIHYGIPDVLGPDKAFWAGKDVAVVGSGHSAMNALLDLAKLQKKHPDTKIHWIVRRTQVNNVFGGGADDQLAARGALGEAARHLAESGNLQTHTGFRIARMNQQKDGVEVVAEDGRRLSMHRLIVATGARPDLSFLREVRLDLDPALESNRILGPLIDPNFHSCGTVRPHGAAELTHPEKDFYIIGMKSYGRAPTFLMATGYEQARSVVARLMGDDEAAARVELELPETGVCSTNLPGLSTACCAPEKPAAKAATPETAFFNPEKSEENTMSSSCCPTNQTAANKPAAKKEETQMGGSCAVPAGSIKSAEGSSCAVPNTAAKPVNKEKQGGGCCG